jgi:ABC-type branched-subunit amino acid transport system permease subunit
MDDKRHPFWSSKKMVTPSIYAIVVVILCLLPLFIKSPYLIHVLITTLIYIVATVSLRLITISGQFPLAHGAYMGIGAYTSAILAKSFGWPIGLSIPTGGLLAMVIGILIGFPFARLRALYYAMVSLFFGIGVIQVIIMFPEYTMGTGGLIGIPPLLHVTSKVPYYYFFLGFTVLCLLALWRFEYSRIGLSLKAIAQSHMVASSVGINEAFYKVVAVAVGCFFVGIAGAVYGHYNVTLSTTSFDFLATMWLFIYVLIGGVGKFAGPIIGTALLIIVPELFRELKEYVPFISAGILLIVFYVMHDGLVGLPGIISKYFVKRSKEKEIKQA